MEKKSRKAGNSEIDIFALSKTQQIKGNRRLVREKVLQILFALNFCDAPRDELFNHIFYRMYKFDTNDEEKIDTKKILKPEEIQEIEADIPIHWSTSEIEFGKDLIAKTLENQKQFDELIEKFSKNWEFDRIALIDKIIMRMTIAQFLYFPLIPIKVAINEAIELAKLYSTNSSSTFINGILDAVKSELLEKNMIKKEGKGLIENNPRKNKSKELN
ncbi:MAG TPA: transcription antitermination factor NusB [Candidatus Kapabacteria bacterium]|nr:transcription antitermination factor NusB [Candidatus Kapabacteria bacterium]